MTFFYNFNIHIFNFSPVGSIIGFLFSTCIGYSFLETSSSIEWSSLYKLVSIRPTKVRHTTIIVMAEIRSCGALVSYIVGSFLIISVKLSSYKRTLGPHVSEVKSVSREVVMFPAAKDIIGDGVEVVSTVFVTIIVVVTAGEAVAWIGAGCSPLHPGLTDTAPDCVLPVQPAHVVHHLVVKV